MSVSFDSGVKALANCLPLTRGIQVIFLDWDGVFADTLQHSHRYAAEAQKEMGCGRAPTLRDFQEVHPLTFPAIAERIGISGPQVHEFTKRVFELQKSETDIPELFRGMAEMLGVLSLSAPVVIVTASEESLVRRTAARARCDQYIAAVLDGTSGKSKAERMRHYLAQNDIDPNRAVMGGDALSDLVASTQAGIPRSIAIGWGFQSVATLMRGDPWMIAKSPLQLPAIVWRAGYQAQPTPLEVSIGTSKAQFCTAIGLLMQFMAECDDIQPVLIPKRDFELDPDPEPIGKLIDRVINQLNNVIEDFLNADKKNKEVTLRHEIRRVFQSFGKLELYDLLSAIEMPILNHVSWNARAPEERIAWWSYHREKLVRLVAGESHLQNLGSFSFDLE